MLVRRLDELKRQGREKVGPGGVYRSIRLLSKEDRLGFSVSDVYLPAGDEVDLWYKHHWEANYVLEGTAEVEDLATGEKIALEPGVMYVVGPRDKHRLRTTTELHLFTIFTPALEDVVYVHDEDGSFPPTGPVPEGPA
jgi:L-ectoine synthase